MLGCYCFSPFEVHGLFCRYFRPCYLKDFLLMDELTCYINVLDYDISIRNEDLVK